MSQPEINSESQVQPITDERLKRIYIDQAINELVAASLRVTLPGPEGGADMIRCKVHPASTIQKLVFELQESQVRALEHLHKTADCLSLLYLRGQLLVGLSSPSWVLEKNLIRMEPTGKAFRIQRRKDVRLQIGSGYDIPVWFEGLSGERGKIQRRLLDVSVSGIGIHILSSREAMEFKKNMMIKNVVFQIQDHRIRIDGQIASHVELGVPGEAKGIKLGIRFIRISQTDREFLMAYIATHLSSPILGL
jgi:hypothetical protein